MTNAWSAIFTALGGVTGFATLLGLFIVPAAKRAEDSQKWRTSMERKVARLMRSDANNRAIISVLIQRDEFLVSRLKEHEPDVIIEPLDGLLKRLNLSLVQIAGNLDEDEDEESKPSASP